jgi:hypothetical protein
MIEIELPQRRALPAKTGFAGNMVSIFEDLKDPQKSFSILL